MAARLEDAGVVVNVDCYASNCCCVRGRDDEQREQPRQFLNEHGGDRVIVAGMDCRGSGDYPW